MPIIQVEMLKGRTIEQKREMAKEVTEAVSRTAIIREMEFENFSEGGVLRCDKK